ncbi:FusB/FusC family EF-G-binding protein [Halobacillus sp. A1]|uniref:FusB/FusC family EF-G-binding protein n=1 Tax=Halobacillus sp. A1 TaxID=2880262 RepID=UPI0020A6BF9D|nr:FusB/FusC family EF-G-binding protein [Halobacillus sp. A1]MCP3032049.1 FusB/FusC family EF-G-binding protein [Halobacillus sp. A1]
MESFIRNDQFNLIKSQTHQLINGHSTVKDSSVLQALKSLSEEKVLQSFQELSGEQEDMVRQVTKIEDQADAVLVLSRLKHYVLPFPEIKENTLKKLFPNVKKMKFPLLLDVDRRELSYLGWDDHGAHRKYIVFQGKEGLQGMAGSFTKSSQNGICSICNQYERVGMFTTTIKESDQHTVKRGNYICQDSMACNQHLTKIDPFYEFVDRLMVNQ